MPHPGGNYMDLPVCLAWPLHDCHSVFGQLQAVKGEPHRVLEIRSHDHMVLLQKVGGQLIWLTQNDIVWEPKSST